MAALEFGLKDIYPRIKAKMHKIVFLCVEDVQLIDVAGPMDVFDTANRVAGKRHYRTSLASLEGGLHRSSSGLAMATVRARDVRSLDTLVIPGSFTKARLLTAPLFSRQADRLARRATRVVSICNGAFALGAIGLLRGRRATTHWSDCERLAAAQPDADVEPNRIFVQDGHVFTSGGATAGTDLAMAIVAKDLGVEVAREVAKWLVLFLQRPGGQSQFSAAAAMPVCEFKPIDDALSRIHEDPAANHRVDLLARHVGVSRRHFARLFRAHTGTTVARYVETVRLQLAATLLESTHLGHDSIAARCGYSSAELLRQAFRRDRSITPSEHRERFAAF
jgi:transcriptional regulator GlxA family with amidase domain